MAITIDTDRCIGCGCCADVCAFGALELSEDKAVVSPDACTECHSCIVMCPVDAITFSR